MSSLLDGVPSVNPPQGIHAAATPAKRAAASLDAVGLSLSHISPQVETPPQVKYAVGASLCKVFCGGGLAVGGGRRGRIVGRSAQSRRRLLDTLHSVRHEAYEGALFLTLTYPDAVEPTPERVARDLDCLAERLRRRFPALAAVWSQELQDRKSGEHVGKVYPHYHLIVFNVRRIDGDWLRRAWFEVVGSGDEKHLRAGIRIEQLRGARQGIGYVGKYVSKEALAELGWTGRTWGVFGREQLPVSFAYAELSMREFHQMRRILRHYVKRVVSRRGRRVRFPSDRTSGVTAYISDATTLKLLLMGGGV